MLILSKEKHGRRLGGAYMHCYITFGMIIRGEVELHIQGCSDGSEEVGYKLGAMVGGDMRQNTVFGEYVHNK